MDVADISRQIRLLLTHLSLVTDAMPGKRVLLVEGRTDRRFIEKKLRPDVRCELACNALEPERAGGAQGNHKDAIVGVVTGLKMRTVLQDIPKNADQWDVYGMIDRDEDDYAERGMIERLFVTDTHDIETLMLSTDDTLLKRTGGGYLSDDEIMQALFIAYQQGYMMRVINDMRKKLKIGFFLDRVRGGSGAVNYDAFLERYRISLRKFLQYANENSADPVPKPGLKKLTEALLKDKRMKKRLDRNGVWSTEWTRFQPGDTDDLWRIVNGHDLLSALQYRNSRLAGMYGPHEPGKLNRKFEIALIDAYDTEAFTKTALYESMQKAEIV